VNDVGRMIGSMWQLTEGEEAIYRETPRSRGIENQARKPRADPIGPAGPGPFRSGSVPSSSPRLIFTFST
jgi:hypothetical protein